MNLEEALKYPITSVPLAISHPDSTVRFSENKSELRNMFMEISDAHIGNIKSHCSWFIDGMAAVRAMKSRETYREWLDAFFQFLTPSSDLYPVKIGIINDVYINESVKRFMRRSRGDTGDEPKVKTDGFDKHILQMEGVFDERRK